MSVPIQLAVVFASVTMLLGVMAVVKPVTSQALVQTYLVGRNYQMALVAFDVGSDPDQYSLWHTGAGAGALNFAYAHGWGVIDQDLENGRAAVDQSARLAAYIDFQMLIADAAPVVRGAAVLTRCSSWRSSSTISRSSSWMRRARLESASFAACAGSWMRAVSGRSFRHRTAFAFSVRAWRRSLRSCSGLCR